MAATPSAKRATTSTLAEGLHVYPPFYACYMLRSFKVQNGKGNRRTYIGSTPDPPRRWRQHNGDISGGAWKTKMWRPWEMEVICFNFPSKLVALQFEWAWNSPYASRHLRTPDEQPMFAKSVGTGPESRIRVLQAMLTTRPWSRFPLKVMLFSQEAREVWDRCLRGETFNKISRRWKPGASPPSTDLSHVKVADRFIGVDGGRLARIEAAATVNKDPLPVSDSDFVIEQYEKVESLKEGTSQPRCGLCSDPVNLDDPLSFALCTSTPTCHYIAHLRCLAPHFLAADSPDQIVPDRGTCPGCRASSRWGDQVKGAFHRQPTSAKLKAQRALEVTEAQDEGDESASPAKRRPAPSTATKKKRATPSSRVTKTLATGRKQRRGPKSSGSGSDDSDDFAKAMDAIVESDGSST